MAFVVVVAGCGVVTADNLAPGSGSFEDDAGDIGFSDDASPTQDLDASSSCRISSPLAFSAGDYRSAVAPSMACQGAGADGGTLWDEFYDNCLGATKDSAACASFKTEYAACASCIVTSYSADALGPILDYGQYVGGNVAGCIELEVPGDPSCPKAVQALTECELAACAANCPVTDPTSLSARNACAMAADQTACKSLFQMASACRAAEADAGLGKPCALGPFKDFYDQVVPLFCASPPVAADAGALDAPATDVDADRDAAHDAAEPVTRSDAGAEYDAKGD